MSEEVKVRYTTILHQVKEDLGIDNDTYVLADSIFKLKENEKVPGWCYASRKYLGEVVGCTERNIRRMINKLVELELIEIQPHTHYLRTTIKWSTTVNLRKQKDKDSADDGGGQNVRGGAKSAPLSKFASAQTKPDKMSGGTKCPVRGDKMSANSIRDNKRLSKDSSVLGSKLYTRVSRKDFKRLAETINNLTGKIKFEEILETLIDKSIEFIFIENDSRIRKYYKKNILDISKPAVIKSVLAEYKHEKDNKPFQVIEKIYTLTCEILAVKLSR